VRAAAAALAAGELTSVELGRALLARADRLDGELGSYLSRFDEPALASAARADDERRAGRAVGPLHGVPFAVKDLMATVEAPTSAHSAVQAFPAGPDAECVTRLRGAGMVLLGKTTLNEYATGPIDPSSRFPVPRNPHDPTRWAGGSSSGSASGVAAGLFPAAIGTDTGGSIRIPAAFCGVVGFKPTFGSVPTAGVAPLGWTADTVGPIAHTVDDCRMLLAALTGGRPDTDRRRPGGILQGLPVGVDRSWADLPGLCPELETTFDRAVGHLRDAGATLVDLPGPLGTDAELAITVAQTVEAFEYHRDTLAERWHEFGVGTRAYLAHGAFYRGADYLRAQRVRAAASQRLRRLFTEVACVVSPTVGVEAPPIEADHGALIARFFTRTWNSVGFPAISLPMGTSAAGLPLGIQFAGGPGQDELVLDVAAALEHRLGG
jgi:aspartyl-tRNA(Asn)/glutamyl-tRNA(Gln) amidotransferase subunit A